MAKIKEVRAIRTRSCGHWLIVKIVTDQPGLYGIGSASDYYQTPIVKAAIDEWLAPLLVGRDASRIEDIWQTTYTAAGWRNGALMNTVMSGMDMALWDIKGKEAGLPLYQLLGGACRSAVPCYAHAEGHDFGSLLEETEKYLEEGFPVIRCQIGDGYGGGGYVPAKAHGPKNSWVEGDAFDDEVYLETITDLFEFLRQNLGFGPKLCHDVHEHLRPQNAVALAKRLEPFRLFFLEDALAPEQVHWYRLIREQCTTPQAMGENFVNPHEYLPLITERLIDYVRNRVSKTGGITPCRKIATLCEWYGVQTAWQQGGDNDPVNQAAAVHLDLVNYSFGIQEENHFAPEEREAFPGTPVLEGGYLYSNDQPGLGVDIDEEKAAALLDPDEMAPGYTNPPRRADGTVIRP